MTATDRVTAPTPRSDVAVELAGHHQALPRRRRQPRRRPAWSATGDGARARRRERRRQVDADEDPVRHAAARRGHDHASTAAQVRFTSPADAIAAGIGMVHQHFMLADNLTVLENVVLGGEPRTAGACSTSGPPGGASPRSRRRVRPRRRPRPPGRRPRRRRAPARRDPQGALPRRPHPHPRRADRGARAAGGRRAVRQPARARGRGPHRRCSSRTSSTRCCRVADDVTVLRARHDRRDRRPDAPRPPASSPSSWSAASCRRPRPASRPSPTRRSCASRA